MMFRGLAIMAAEISCLNDYCFVMFALDSALELQVINEGEHKALVEVAERTMDAIKASWKTQPA